MYDVNFWTVPVCTGWYWSAPSPILIWTGVMCCSGREDQRVCGFEVLRGGHGRKPQRVGGGEQQQHQPSKPDVRKPAAVVDVSFYWDQLPLMTCECMWVPGVQVSSTLTTWESSPPPGACGRTTWLWPPWCSFSSSSLTWNCDTLRSSPKRATLSPLSFLFELG